LKIETAATGKKMDIEHLASKVYSIKKILQKLGFHLNKEMLERDRPKKGYGLNATKIDLNPTRQVNRNI